MASRACPINLKHPALPWAVLAGLMAGVSLTGVVLEFGFDVLPCPMCWWQRWAHYGLFSVALLGLSLPAWRRWLALTGVLVALVGLGVAFWQVAAQNGWLSWPPSCTAAELVPLAAGADLLGAMQVTKVVPCDQETFKLLGVSLAGWNVPVMLGVLGVLGWGARQR